MSTFGYNRACVEHEVIEVLRQCAKKAGSYANAARELGGSCQLMRYVMIGEEGIGPELTRDWRGERFLQSG